LQHMQGQLQQQKQVPPELMIMAQHMQQQLTGMGMLQNALTSGHRGGIPGSSAGMLPPGFSEACHAAALGLIPADWVQQQMLPVGFGMPPGPAGGLMPPSGILMAAGPGPEMQAQAVKQQQQQIQQQMQLQQAASQLAAATGGPMAAQFAAALQGQQLGPNPIGSNPQQQPAVNPASAPAQSPGLAGRWPDGIEAAAAAAAAGFWPGLGGGVGLSADAAAAAAAAAAGSERLPGLTGLGMSGMTPMGGLSAGQGQCGAMGLGTQLGGQGGARGMVGPAATAPSVGGGDGGRSFVDTGRAGPSAAAGAGVAGGGSAAAGYGQGGSVGGWEAGQQASAQGQQQQPLASTAVQAGVGVAPSWL
jgi:hypothetical protein